MNTTSSILIFNNTTSFLGFMETLQEAYNKDTCIYGTKTCCNCGDCL